MQPSVISSLSWTRGRTTTEDRFLNHSELERCPLIQMNSETCKTIVNLHHTIYLVVWCSHSIVDRHVTHVCSRRSEAGCKLLCSTYLLTYLHVACWPLTWCVIAGFYSVEFADKFLTLPVLQRLPFAFQSQFCRCR